VADPEFMKSIDHHLARLSALGWAWASSPGVWTDLCRAVARWAAQAQQPKGPSQVADFWPATQAHLKVGHMTLSGTDEETRKALDELFALWIDEAPRFGAVAAHFPESLRKRRFVASFWAPEVLLFGDLYRAGFTRPEVDEFCVGIITQRTAEGRWFRDRDAYDPWQPSQYKQPFWSPELPEVMERTRHPSSKRTYFAPYGPGNDEKPWKPVRIGALSLLLLVLALPGVR